MAIKRLGVIMHGITGRMGYNQHLVRSILAIRDQVAPPTINLTTPDPECDLDYVPNGNREKKLGAVLNMSFGFGGHNACVIFSKYQG